MSWKHFGKLMELATSAAKAYTQKPPYRHSRIKSDDFQMLA